MAHPDFDGSPTQNFLKASGQLMPDVTYHVLDQLYPDYQIDVAKERAILAAHTQIIFQFPLYWYSAPTALKAWLDQVLQTKDEERLPNYTGKTLGLVVATGTAEKQFDPGGSEQFTLAEILRPYQALAHKLQMTYRTPLIISQFSYLTEIQKQRLLIQYQQYLTMTATNFTAQTDWFVQRLVQLQQKKPDQPQLAAILATITANQEQLADLKATLALMKGEISDGSN